MPTGKDLQNIRLARELHALTEIAKTLTSPLPLHELLQSIMDKIIGVLEPADIGAVMLWDQSSGLFRPAAAFGYDLNTFKEISLREGESITGKVYEQEEILLLSSSQEVATAMADLSPSNREILANSLETDALPLCTVASPIMVGENKNGVLLLETLQSKKRFVRHDLPFVQTLADLIALAIDRERLRSTTEAIRESHEVDRLRSELMAALSHELRLPLTGIKGYASALLLEEVEWDREKQTSFLHFIEEECDNMQVILADMLDSSLIEVEQLNMQLQPIRLNKIANDITQEMQRRTDEHDIMVDFPTSFPLVEADPHWIRQVFRNIIENAIKYSPEGGLIVIRGEVRSSDVVVSTADQGIGISPEETIQIFEKFQRSASTGTYRVPGMGLGLPIARTIVEAHKGRIWVASQIGQGTTLYFSLPLMGTRSAGKESWKHEQSNIDRR